jgi:hypothetical protein
MSEEPEKYDVEVCEWNPIWDEYFETVSNSMVSLNACRVRANNSCGSGSFIGLHQDGALVMSNAHVTGSRVGSTSTFQFDPTVSGSTQSGRIIMAAYSTKVTADWSISLIPGWKPRIKPAYLSRTRPTSQERFRTTGSPACVWPLRHQKDLRLLSNNNAGFAVLSGPAVGGQSGSAIHDMANDLQKFLLTWRTGSSNNMAGQPLDFIYAQAKTAIETGALIGGALPEDIELLSEINPDCHEGFEAEMSIRSLPIWFEDLKPAPPKPDEPIDPDEPCESPIAREELLAYLRKQKDDAETMLNRIERCNDDTPINPPSNGNTFGL